MPRGVKKEYTLKEIAEHRYRIMNIGCMNKSDLQRFVPCGASRANSIWNYINSKVANDGKDPLMGKVIHVDRVMAYLGITAKDIEKLYLDTKKDSA